METHGRVGIQRSTIARGSRGGLPSRIAAVLIIIPSRGSCPEWLATITARPSGSQPVPWASTRK